MVTARIDFNKIKKQKDLSYLDGWYCPVEAVVKAGSDRLPDWKFQFGVSLQFASSPKANRVPLNVSHKHVMAGL